MSDIIVARDLVKRYGAFTAVDAVSFSVSGGQCFGPLGPEGAPGSGVDSIRLSVLTSVVT